MAAEKMISCGVSGCTEPRREWELACKKHWFKLPKKIRDEVWAQYRKKKGSPEHMAVIRRCYEFWRAQE